MLTGENDVIGENMCHCQNVQHKFHMDCSRNEPRPHLGLTAPVDEPQNKTLVA